jgi:1-phosphatidylinositol-3-phosphate 5-kinase
MSQRDYCFNTFVFISGPSKTLMFFEGCSSRHLGCTVLLRGTTNSELAKLKRVVSRLVFTQSSWRLEKSFLMDEFALPPSPPTDSFFEEPVISDSSQNDPVISSTNNCTLCDENDSAVVLSDCELLHESCEDAPEDPKIHRHVLSPKIGIVNNESIRNGTSIVPVACTLPYNTVGENAKDGNIRSISRNDVPLNSNVQLYKNVQSENSSLSNRKKYVCCDKAEHLSPSCTNCSKTSSSGNRKQTDDVRESRNTSTGEENISVCELIHQLTQAKEAQVLPGQTDCDSAKTQAARIGSKEKSLSEEKRINVESVSDFSDPLHLYLSLDDDVFSTGNQGTGSGQLSVAELPLTNRFRKALDDTILSSSPYLQVMLSLSYPHPLITAQNMRFPCLNFLL